MCCIEKRPCRSAREGFCICAAWWHLVAGTTGTRRSLVRVGRLLVGNKRYLSVELQKAREWGKSGTWQRWHAELSALVLVAHSVPSCCAPDIAGRLREIPNNPRGVRVKEILNCCGTCLLRFCRFFFVFFLCYRSCFLAEFGVCFSMLAALRQKLFNFIFEVPWKRLDFGQLDN